VSKAFESRRFCNIFIEDNQLKIRSLLFFKCVRNEALCIVTNLKTWPYLSIICFVSDLNLRNSKMTFRLHNKDLKYIHDVFNSYTTLDREKITDFLTLSMLSLLYVIMSFTEHFFLLKWLLNLVFSELHFLFCLNCCLLLCLRFRSADHIIVRID